MPSDAASAGLTEEPVAVALKALRASKVPGSNVRQLIEGLAAKLDDKYFRLDEDHGHDAHNPEALRMFSKARAMSALAFALTDDDTKLHESIYEAISAMDDPTELVRLLDAALH